METGHTLNTLTQTPPRQPLASLIHHLDIMVIFSPIIADEQLPFPQVVSTKEKYSYLMDQCSPARHPTSHHFSSPTGRGTV